MKVRHAKLLNVYGRAARYGGYTIVPAYVEPDGGAFRPEFRSVDLPADRVPPILRVPIEEYYDVAWVRARLPYAFGISPDRSDVEKTLLSVEFVAVPEGQDEAVPFWCSDTYGRTALWFSNAETDRVVIDQVASAFWGVLLSEPNALEDFEVWIDDWGEPFTLHLGCEDGVPFRREV